jgi:acyl-CoA synthetase (AMP-forming)/AMP-acid ligase II
VEVPQETPGSACYVGVGGPYTKDGTTCRIVNPDTRECQGQGRVGEIWLDGPSRVRVTFGRYVCVCPPTRVPLLVGWVDG